MESFETFGTVLSRFMRSRHCSMKELAAKMEIKSANTIARITADKSGIGKIRSFCDELLEKNPLGLVEAEKEILREAVVVSEMGVDAYKCNQQLLNFLRVQPQGPDCICKHAFGDDSLFVVTLDDLLGSYQEYAQVNILLQNCALSGVTRAIRAFLEQCGDVGVSVEHYVSTSDNRVRMLTDFTALLDVMGHPCYQFFFSPLYGGNSENAFEAYDHILMVLKCDRQGNKWTDIVRFHTADSFDLLYNVPGEASYQFNLLQFHAMRLQHNPAKADYRSEFSFSGMLEYNSRLLEMDLKYPSLTIQPDIGLCMVPPDITENVADSAGIYDAEHSGDAFLQYVQVAARRFQLFANPEHPRKFIFSKSGMFLFYQKGKSSANVFGLRDLTLEERRRIIRGIIEVAGRDSGTTIHLIKNELHYNNISYFLYDDKVLLIDNYQSFSNFDSTKSYNSCCIQSAEIVKNFAGFMEHNLLRHYVYSNEESIAFLEELLVLQL